MLQLANGDDPQSTIPPAEIRKVQSDPQGAEEEAQPTEDPEGVDVLLVRLWRAAEGSYSWRREGKGSGNILYPQPNPVIWEGEKARPSKQSRLTNLVCDLKVGICRRRHAAGSISLWNKWGKRIDETRPDETREGGGERQAGRQEIEHRSLMPASHSCVAIGRQCGRQLHVFNSNAGMSALPRSPQCYGSPLPHS